VCGLCGVRAAVHRVSLRLTAEQGFKEKAVEKYEAALNAPLPTGL
jgi:hypothetical protein